MSAFVVRPLRRLLLRRPVLARHLHRSSAWAARKLVQPFKLADIGEGITECEVIKWSVKPSSAVQVFDPLCEVQSDKASVEITSPFEGVVTELLVKEGEVAKVGSNLCLIEVEDESSEDAGEGYSDQLPLQKSEPAPTESKYEELEPQEGIVKEVPERRLHPLDPRAQAERLKVDGSNVLALPSVRHFAKQSGVDLSLLAPGSGKGGRIGKKDVESYLSRASSGSASSSSSPSQMAPENDVVVELGRTRHAMWKAMAKSLEIPHFGYSTYLDLTNLHNMLPLLNTHIPPHYLLNPPEDKPMSVNPSAIHPAPSPPDVPPTAKYSRLTYLPFLLKTLSRAMTDWPLFRSSITPSPESSASQKPTLTVRPHADISIALSTPTGLYTPTLQRVDTHSVYALAARLAHVSALGRRTPSGLGPAEMPRAGGTLTLSNVGALGRGEFAHPVLVPGGGVAIVAIGRARWVRDEERHGERRLQVGVSWSADHRVVEGAELAAFVECWRAYIEYPERLVADAV
ncbi:CoA-dependent acyltransferase [Phellopilus nigrolimitatus]|nr:CoA-dependent acyltransferase [Phellopilus nigrolimitatus]